MHALQFIMLPLYPRAGTGSQHCCLWQHVIPKFMTNPPFPYKQRCCVAAVASCIPYQLQVCAPQAAGAGHASHCFFLVRAFVPVLPACHKLHLIEFLIHICPDCWQISCRLVASRQCLMAVP